MKKIGLFIVIFLATTGLYAQDGQQTEETEAGTSAAGSDAILVTARGYDKPASSTPGGVGVITDKTIEKTNPVSVSDALEQIPGVYKSSDGSWGSEVSIRGASRDKVVLLIDGSRMNTATDIGAQFGTLDPLSVERIEVLKGPISSLYGSGAIGGVVNVITRNGKFTDTPGFQSGISLSGESTSWGYNTYAFTSYNSRSWYVFASGSYRHHGSYHDGGGHTVTNTDFSDAQGAMNMGVKPAANHTIEIRTQYYQGWDIGIPGAKDTVPSTASSADYTKLPRALVSLDYTWKPGSDIWRESKVHLFWQYIGRNVTINNQLPAPANLKLELKTDADHNTAGAKWTNILSLGDHTVVAGTDSWIRTISSTRKKTKKSGTYAGDYQVESPFPEAAFVSNGLFAEDDWKLGDWTINFGARGDYIYVTNDSTYIVNRYFTTPAPPAVTTQKWIRAENNHEFSWDTHAGVTYRIIEQISTSILAASGYRAASLEERYKYIDLGTKAYWGNPDLDPERSFFFEYGLHLKTKHVTSNASAYANILRDLIADKLIRTNATNPTEVYELQNISRALLWGTEYDTEVRIIEWLALYGDLTWIRGRDTKNDENLRSIAPLRLTGGIRFSTPFGLAGFFDTVYTADQNKVPSGYKKSPDWVRLDTGLSYTVRFFEADHRVFVSCTNLLDTEYYDYLTMSKTGLVFNEPGRSFKAGYSVLF